MEYVQKCKDARAHSREIHRNEEEIKRMKLMFSEFAESKDESIRKELINIINLAYDSGIAITAENRDKYLDWLDEQKQNMVDYKQNHQCIKHPNGCITLIDFNDGEGRYKLHLDYLNKNQVKQIEEIVKVWDKELNLHNENIKACIGMCLTDVNEQRFKDYNTNLKECLDYLEKQGEQEKPQVYETADGDIITYSKSDGYKVVKPKFKPGDWITNGMCTWKIEFIEDGLYYQNDGDIECGGDIESIDKEYHLWSIKDAKAGDILCDYHEAYDNPLIFILKKFEQVNFGLVRPSDYSSYCFLTAGDIQRFKEGTYHHKHNIKPATNEQRDRLFIKMKESGYEWDAEKKKLKKIEQEPNPCDGCVNRRGCINCENGELRETEKQGNKPQDKSVLEAIKEEKVDNANKVVVEPKFKVGDWITNGDYTWKIVEIKPLDYILQSQDGNIVDDTISHVDEQFHSFTIKDIKDGDVLATKNAVFIFKHIDKTGLSLCKSYCEVIGNSALGFGFDFSINCIYPATKEQCDLLFQKMKKAGYEWDAEKKELKKIDNKIEIPFSAKDSELQEATYFIPKGFHAEIDGDNVVIKKGKKLITWNDEDELSCFERALFTAFSDAWQSYLLGEKVNVKQWAKEQSKELLEAAKEELTEHNSDWSEEDESNLDGIIDEVEANKNWAPDSDTVTYDRFISWLKSLKDRVQPQSKREWSEKDEKMIEASIGFIKSSPYPYSGDTLRGEINKADAENWFKSLRYRVQPQSKQEWSEEDKQKIDRIYYVLMQAADTHAFSTSCRLIGDKECVELQDFLKSLNDRMQPKQEQEWNDEDKQYLLICKNALAKYQITDKWDANIISHWLENKLKSLGYRVQ